MENRKEYAEEGAPLPVLCLRIKFVREIVELMENARRGTEKDDPEGNRYIRISDTLAKEIARRGRSLL